MLPATSRMRRRDDFSATMRRGPGSARAARSTIVVHWSDSPRAADEMSPPVVGFVVSRAVGPAVTRNRVRRRLRHLVRERLPQLPGGCRLVVRATPAAALASYHELRSDLDMTLAQLARKVAP